MALGNESRSSKSLAACKIESSYGADPSITGSTDAFLTYESAESYKAIIDMANEQAHSASRTNRLQTPGKQRVERRVKFWLQGGTGAGVADDHSPLIQCCGVKEVIAASTSCTYTPALVGTEDKSAKLVVEHDNLLFSTAGLYGNFVMRGAVGGAVTVEFTGRGLYTAPSASTISGWAGGVKRAKPFVNVAMTLTGTTTFAPVINAWEFNRGVNVEEIDDANSATGIAKTFILNADPTITLTAAADRSPAAETMVNRYTYWLAMTTRNMAFTIAGAAGNNIAMSFPELQIRDIAPRSIRGVLHEVITLGAQSATDQSEFSWVIT